MSTGCSNNQSLPIPVYDADGDLIKCRCSNNVCLSGLAMDVNNCIIYFNPTASGYYTIEIIIEDYALSVSNSPLSSVPLQFIVFVQANTIYCCKWDFNKYFKTISLSCISGPSSMRESSSLD